MVTRLFFILFIASSLFAQQQNVAYNNEFSVLFGNSENGYGENIGRSPAYQMQFQYNGLDTAIKPEIALVYSPEIPLYKNSHTSNTDYTMLMINGVYEIAYADLLTPYLKGGIGYVGFGDVPDSPSNALFLDTGAGLKLHLSERWAVKFEASVMLGADYSNILATCGINFTFGRRYVAPPPEKVCEPCEEPKTVYVTNYVTKEAPKPIQPYHVQFTFAKATLTDDAKASIKAYAEKLNRNEYRKKELIIIGNADNKGARSFNATLSIRRANAVRSEFIANDVDPARITVDALGETYPIADNETEAGREENRRVIIIVKE